MDPHGLTFPIVVAAIAAAGLFWHISRARQGRAGPHDRWMGALWAAVLVLAAGRVIVLVAQGSEPKPADDAGAVK